MLFGHKKNKISFSRPRIKALLLSVLVFVSVVTTLPILQSTNASALTISTTDPSTFDDQIKAVLLSGSIYSCMVQDFDSKNLKDLEDIKSWKWFGNWAVSKVIYPGVFLKGQYGVNDGSIACGDTSFIQQAINYLGITNPAELFCNIGATLYNTDDDSFYRGDSCRSTVNSPSSGTWVFKWEDLGENKQNTILANNFIKYIRDKTGLPSSLSSAQNYIYYRNSLYSGCMTGVTNLDVGEQPNTTTYKDKDTIFTNINWVDINAKKIESGWYTGTSSKTTEINIWPWEEEVSGNNLSNDNTNSPLQCSEIAKRMSDNAKAYLAVWKKYLEDNPEGAEAFVENSKEDGSNTGTSCAIDGIGWIVCPVLTFLGKISDTAFSFLADSFLSTDTSLVNTNSPTYKAWTTMRNYANIAFVIAFLIIIFSQITNVGISNYGIKKMLPRLVIAAILVNISFFVCQIAVDISNILGYSLKGVFDSFRNFTAPDTIDASSNGWGIALLVTGGLVAGVGVILVISIPVLLAVLLALFMTVLILVARTALITLLIVISPLAFVAYLLPNTEEWFKKWGKMFAGLLLVFPIIAVLFGAGNLAAKIINANAGSDNKIMQLVAVGVAAVPLFAVPSLLKGSMNAAGSIGTKLSGWSDKANSRASGAASKKASERYGNTSLARGIAARAQYKQQYRDQKFARKLGTSPLTKFLAKSPIPLTGASRQANSQLESAALMAANKADNDDVTARQALQENKILAGSTTSDKEFQEAVAKNDIVGARSAMNIQLKSAGGRDRAHDLIKGAYNNEQFVKSGNLSKLQGHIASTNPSLSDTDAALGTWSNMGGDLTKIENSSDTYKIADGKMAGQTLTTMQKASSLGVLDKTQAERINAIPALTKDLKPAERAHLEKIAGVTSPTTAPPINQTTSTATAPSTTPNLDEAGFWKPGDSKRPDEPKRPV